MKRTLIVLFGVVGCGDGESSRPDAGPAADAAVDAGVVPTKEGQVFIGQLHAPEESGIAMATFVDGKLVTQTATAGGCYTGVNTPPTSLPAGVVTVTGTAAGTLTLAQAQANAPYTAVGNLPDALFAAGATLGVTTTGATVPAFTASVTTPAVLSTTTLPSLSRTTGGTMTWAAGNGDRMIMLVLSSTLDSAMICEAPDTGSFQLTAAALALIPTATAVTVTTYRLKESIVNAGDWKVFVRIADGVASGEIAIAN